MAAPDVSVRQANSPSSNVPAPQRGSAVLQFGLVGLALLLYLLVRALTSGDYSLAVAHARHLLSFERHLGIDWELGVQHELIPQRALLHFFNVMYVWAYWPVLAFTLIILWRVDRARYRLTRNALFISGIIGLLFFALYPVAPPRMLSGFTDTLSDAARGHFLHRPTRFANQYAALPSFHAGWFALCLAMLAASKPHLLTRGLAALASAAMVIAVIVTANHYVIDVAAGLAIAGAGWWLAARFPGRRPGPYIDLTVTTPPCDAGAERRCAAGASHA